jgi:hypothetical protein
VYAETMEARERKERRRDSEKSMMKGTKYTEEGDTD